MLLVQKEYVLNVLNKIFDEKGDPDGGGLSWLAKTAIAIAVLAIILGVLKISMPDLLNTMFDKLKSFFA